MASYGILGRTGQVTTRPPMRVQIRVIPIECDTHAWVSNCNRSKLCVVCDACFHAVIERCGVVYGNLGLSELAITADVCIQKGIEEACTCLFIEYVLKRGRHSLGVGVG